MCWKVFQLVFEAKSPLHIGGKRVGMIQRTRYYIPAMTFWGALTARLTRKLYDHPDRESYRAVGEFCHNHLCTSYFFPTVDYSSGQPLDNLLLPKYNRAEDQWSYGGHSQAEFERIFLSAYGSTAIVNRRTAAEDASLHEIQLLLDRVRDGLQVQRVYFGGYLFAKAGSSCDLTLTINQNTPTVTTQSSQRSIGLFSVIEFIQVGGERAYGYGRLKRFHHHRHQGDELWGGLCKIETGANRLQLKDLKRVPAHLRVNGLDTVASPIRGKLEALVSRQWRNKGVGESIRDLGACFVPGSVVQNPLTVSIEPYGILKASP